jgi:hypothetical protein
MLHPLVTQGSRGLRRLEEGHHLRALLEERLGKREVDGAVEVGAYPMVLDTARRIA